MSYAGGFIAAEGYFGHDGARRFRVAVAVAAIDVGAVIALHQLLGVGRISSSPRRQEHFHDEVCWQVQSLRELVEVVVPFMDEHLPPCHKREQYEVWRAALLEYWERGMRRRRPCVREGCDEPSRCNGLCRRHYYAVYRR